MKKKTLIFYIIKASKCTCFIQGNASFCYYLYYWSNCHWILKYISLNISPVLLCFILEEKETQVQ